MPRVLRLTVVIGLAVVIGVPALMALVGLVRLPAIDRDITTAGDTAGDTARPGADPDGDQPGAWGLADQESSADDRSVRGVSCRRTGSASFEVIDAGGEDPSTMMTVAVDLVDEDGTRHRQVVVMATTDAGPRGPTLIQGPAELGSIGACLVTAVQIGDRVTYTGW